MSLAHVALLFLSYAQVYTIRIRISTFPPCALNDHAESRVFFNLVADVHKRTHKAFFFYNIWCKTPNAALYVKLNTYTT